MQECDVLIVGGGPAGSTCAWALQRAGFDVLVVDAAVFPRDKVCAGWITPGVLEQLEIGPDRYAQGRICQPMTAFRVGPIEGPGVRVDYGRPVSYGIRRREFDHYLLQRCGARLSTGHAVRAMQRNGQRWVVDDRFRAPMLVAAGGHFCPVARRLNRRVDGERPQAPFGQSTGHRPAVPAKRARPLSRDSRDRIVVAQEIEFALSPAQRSACPIEPHVPELYFCDDLAGYGWCLRKGDFLNVGLGREDRHGIGEHVGRFCDWLKRRGRIPEDTPPKLRGHAYHIYGHSPRRLLDDGLVAVGDAAGLAYAESGEGIGPAVESGLIAAGVIAAAGGDYRPDRLEPYQQQIIARFGRRRPGASALDLVPAAIRQFVGARLLASGWFARRVVLDRWFLRRSGASRADKPPMAP